MITPIRVLLADDHPAIRAGIRTTLETEDDLVVVGEASDGDMAQQLVYELKPDVLVMDLNMPGSTAVETLACLRERCPHVRVLVLTAYDDDAYVRGMIVAGAAGYVLKEEAMDAVVRAVRTVAEGDNWYSRAVVEKLAAATRPGRTQEGDPSLNDMELQTLELIGQGWDNGHIAVRVKLARQTVRNYTSVIYSKIGVSTRMEAVVWARDHNLTDTPTQEGPVTELG